MEGFGWAVVRGSAERAKPMKVDRCMDEGRWWRLESDCWEMKCDCR
jgi:hypothetical protein